eukprot:365810-Chlamydomonas_euryale.AAC.9
MAHSPRRIDRWGLRGAGVPSCAGEGPWGWCQLAAQLHVPPPNCSFSGQLLSMQQVWRLAILRVGSDCGGSGFDVAYLLFVRQ